MSKITIAIISFIFGMATMNDFNRHKDKIYKWIENKSNKRSDK